MAVYPSPDIPVKLARSMHKRFNELMDKSPGHAPRTSGFEAAWQRAGALEVGMQAPYNRGAYEHDPDFRHDIDLQLKAIGEILEKARKRSGVVFNDS